MEKTKKRRWVIQCDTPRRSIYDSTLESVRRCVRFTGSFLFVNTFRFSLVLLNSSHFLEISSLELCLAVLPREKSISIASMQQMHVELARLWDLQKIHQAADSYWANVFTSWLTFNCLGCVEMTGFSISRTHGLCFQKADEGPWTCGSYHRRFLLKQKRASLGERMAMATSGDIWSDLSRFIPWNNWKVHRGIVVKTPFPRYSLLGNMSYHCLDCFPRHILWLNMLELCSNLQPYFLLNPPSVCPWAQTVWNLYLCA